MAFCGSEAPRSNDPSFRDTWEDWYRDHAERLLLFARSQTRCEADAQDVFQEAVVKAWRSGRRDGAGKDGGAPPLPYVFRAIRQCAIDLGRSIDRRARRERRAAVDWFEPAEESSVSGAEEACPPGELEEALVALPAGQREVVMLRIWGELTFREVGEALGISLETAASRYRYAMERLRRRLAPSRRAAGDVDFTRQTG